MSLTGPGYHQITPLSFMERSARVFPEKEAVVYGSRRWNYAEFAERAQQLAKALSQHAGSGDTVTVVAPNIPETLLAHYSVPLIGGMLSSLNPRLTGREFHHILNHSESKVVLVDSEQVELILEVAETLDNPPVVVEIVDEEFGVPATGKIQTVDEFMAAAPEREDFSYIVEDENSALALNYTSGTTGPPKGVVYTHRGAGSVAMGSIMHYGFNSDTKYLWTLPMFHCNGWVTTWSVTAAGGTHVCLRAVRQDAIWDAFEQEGITHLCGAPIVCSTIVDSPRAKKLDTNPVLVTAAAAPPPSVLAGLENIGIQAIHTYGLTETYGPVTIADPQEHWAELTVEERAQEMSRQGVNMVHTLGVDVVDMDMNPVPADGKTQGEVVMRGNGVMKEYFKDAAATEKAFHGGWYHSGDIAVKFPDGYIKLVDRMKDIIISGGENISSIEVEGVIHGHPEVTDVAVIGIEDEKWGERPVAYVVTTGKVTEDELRAYARERLAGFKVPDAFNMIDELPRTATGKIRKTELRK